MTKKYQVVDMEALKDDFGFECPATQQDPTSLLYKKMPCKTITIYVLCKTGTVMFECLVNYGTGLDLAQMRSKVDNALLDSIVCENTIKSLLEKGVIKEVEQ